MITAQALTAFAAEQLDLRLTAADADRLSRLYTAYIRAQLATLKQQVNIDTPPFNVPHWRTMSATKRLIFGTVTDNKRTSGVVRFTEGMSGVLHKRKDRPGYFAFFFPSDLWSASVLDDDKRKQQLAQLWRTTAASSQKGMITEGRLRASLPVAKQRWVDKRFGVDITDTEWPVKPRTAEPLWATVEGAELADIIILFGLHDRSSSYQQKLPVMLRLNNEQRTLSFSNKQLWVLLTNSPL